nr:DNA polymerase III subunit gamma/tau [uncultured Capnocytophaga sp.]
MVNGEEPTETPEVTLTTPQPNYTTTATQQTTPNIPIITKEERIGAVSGFSIKSVHLKNEHQKTVKEVVIDPNSLPKESFTKEAFEQSWEQYISDLLAKGERIQASILKIANLELDGTVINLQVASNAAKIDVLEMESKLLGYLHKALRNYDISLQLSVNEEISKKILVTPEEKYNKLLEENPLLQDFRTAFGLQLKA